MAVSAPPAPDRTRALVAWASAALALAAAVAGAALAGGGAGPALTLSAAASRVGGLLEEAGRAVPGGYPLAAGMAVAVNPCGFALLPAYLGLYLGAEGAAPRRAPRLARALAVGTAMTSGFVALFGLAGLVLAGVAAAVADLLPWLSLLVGVLLVAAGGRMLAGGTLHAAAAERLAAPLGHLAGRAGLAGYAAYGVAFGLSSLGCALPLFLTVVGTALTATGPLAAAWQVVLYGLGMGLVVTAATVVVALFGSVAVAPAGRLGRWIGPASAVLLLTSGAYVVYYWLSAGGLLA
jgi:cytochrome c biogenesis protein CcdA